MAEVEAAIGLGVERAGIETDRQRIQIFGLAGVKFEPEPAAEPAGKADMIGMAMAGDDAGQRPAFQQAAEQAFPDGARRGVVDAGVEQREAGAVLDQIDIDVIQPERQRQPQPQHALGDFQGFAGGGGFRKAKVQGGGQMRCSRVGGKWPI